MTERISKAPAVDLTEALTFDKPSSVCVDALIEYGAVVVDGVVDEEEMEGAREAVSTLFFESIPKRILFKVLERAPIASVRDAAHHRHSATSQFDPNKIPLRLAGVAGAVERIIDLDSEFFKDYRLRELYAGQPQRLNIADISRSGAKQKAFVPHQDSSNVGRLGHILQPVDTLWTIYGGCAPSKKPFDFTFTARERSVVTTLERVARPPKGLAPGQGLEYFLEDGSQVHGGDNLTGEMRHRLGLFAEQDLQDRQLRDLIVAGVVSLESALRARRASR